MTELLGVKIAINPWLMTALIIAAGSSEEGHWGGVTVSWLILNPLFVLFSFAEYLAACCGDEGEENPP